jgi:hypothetical protein
VLYDKFGMNVFECECDDIKQGYPENFLILEKDNLFSLFNLDANEILLESKYQNIDLLIGNLYSIKLNDFYGVYSTI